MTSTRDKMGENMLRWFWICATETNKLWINDRHQGIDLKKHRLRQKRTWQLM